MKPDYRITLAISSVLIVAALLFPPWKSPYDQNFVGFYFVFEDGANLPYGAQLGKRGFIPFLLPKARALGNDDAIMHVLRC